MEENPSEVEKLRKLGNAVGGEVLTRIDTSFIPKVPSMRMEDAVYVGKILRVVQQVSNFYIFHILKNKKINKK